MGYTEDSLVEQPAIQLFAELGWETLSASDEVIGVNPLPNPPPRGEGISLGRETKSEVVLTVRLRNVLVRLNPSLPPEAISAAVDELSRGRSAMLPAAANRELWALMRDGVKVSAPDLARGGQKDERVRVVDWDDPTANDFLLVSQMEYDDGRKLSTPELKERRKQVILAYKRGFLLIYRYLFMKYADYYGFLL